MPRIKSKLARMEPRREAWTIRISFWIIRGEHIDSSESYLDESDDARQVSLDRSLDNLVNLQDNQFHGIPKGHINQGPNSITQATGNTLSRMAQQPSQGHDGDGVQGKDDGRTQARSFDGDAGRDEDKQNIDPAVKEGSLGMFAEADGAIPETGPDTRFRFLLIMFLTRTRG